MKKIIFLLASFVAIFMAIANNYMHVYLNNGSILDFDTESLLRVDVQKDSTSNSTYLLVVKNDSSTLRIDQSDIQKIAFDDTINSIWGLEVSDVDEKGNVSITFYANIEMETIYGIRVDFFKDYDLFLYIKNISLNSHFPNKSGITFDYIQENDSIYKITVHDVYFNDNTKSIAVFIRVTKDENSNVIRWNNENIERMPVSGQIADHDYVDLGLPSGTLWATYNVGASKPQESGWHLTWGVAYPSDSYYPGSYKWGRDSMTKYNSKDSLTILQPEDDAATVNWGSEWRMPTGEELQELIEYCEYSSTEFEGRKGAKFTATNGNSIFFPAAGYAVDWVIAGESSGYYWSSSLVDVGENPGFLYFRDEKVYIDYGGGGSGHSVRAVCAKKEERNVYSVKFYTSDSTLINAQNVYEGAHPKEVQAPVRTGYEFVGWSTSFDTITSDLSVYAIYKEACVDLGLPSGTLWATYNVGATKPSEYGDYFAWGETKPKEDYSWSTYKWTEDKGKTFTKYVHSEKYGTVDNKMVLEAEDDAATANWGKNWRMPTIEEMQELIENCEYSWTTVDARNGIKFTATNGNSIFIPATGYFNGSDNYYTGGHSFYWSSSCQEKEERALRMYFKNEYGYLLYVGCETAYRCPGYCVRAVRAKN